MNDLAHPIARATPADLGPLTELRRRLAQETDGLLPSADEVTEHDTRRFLESAEVSMFVARQGDDLVGVLSVTRGALRRNHHVARLWMGVVASQWGRGIGHALLHAALRHASASGIRRVELSVREDNTRALALYRRHGLEVEGRRPGSLCVNEEFRDELWLAKLLTAS